ncbi:reverse transcriptase [Teladorsagia circumcincta]|uniref:RNA-directed DNA polymerase n=1 Tax=Teladorsagia circumcincta TaxID=45464 RepID=A0A2G9UV43_TELCI|nr:reverse transcriptase [Teladorsagia circumcincta]
MRLDTGADVTLLSHGDWIAIGRPPLQSPQIKLRSANIKPINVRGRYECNFVIDGQHGRGTCYVADTPSLLGLDWITQHEPLFCRLTEGSIYNVNSSTLSTLNSSLTAHLKKKFATVFKPGLGHCTKSKAKLVLKPDAKPVFQKARPVPYAAVQKISTEIDRLVSTHAYLQLEVDDDSKQLLTINTHRGLYRFNRLPFGVKPAPGIFQQCIDALIAGLDGTIAYLDDILVTGRTIDEHNTRLDAVFQRIQDYGFRVRLEKCSLLQTQIKYLSFVNKAQGRRPDPDKVKAIQKMPTPKDVSQLRAFLGLINFYGNFVKDLHNLPQQNYSQIEKEALALIFAVQKFHRFVHGRHFTLMTDHKPLVAIFGNKKGIPVYSANRLQRWATMLLNYDFAIEHVNTKDFGQVDALSRLIASQSSTPEDYVIANVDVDVNAEFIENCRHLQVSTETIRTATKDDPVIKKVITRDTKITTTPCTSYTT